MSTCISICTVYWSNPRLPDLTTTSVTAYACMRSELTLYVTYGSRPLTRTRCLGSHLTTLWYIHSDDSPTICFCIRYVTLPVTPSGDGARMTSAPRGTVHWSINEWFVLEPAANPDHDQRFNDSNANTNIRTSPILWISRLFSACLRQVTFFRKILLEYQQ